MSREDDDDEALDPYTARLVVRGGAIVCAGLVLAIAWLLLAAPGRSLRPPPALLAASAGAMAAAAAPAVDAKEPSIVRGQRSLTVIPARRIPGLLALPLGFLRGNDLTDAVRFGQALRGTPAVKLVNLWATWCPPCVQENERFVEMSADWGRDVQFVPIHVGPISDPQGYRALVDRMPGAAVSPLVDASGDAVQSLLRGERLLTEEEGIPITMLLDCRDELRWIHVGELVDTTELGLHLGALRSELALPRCAPPPPAPARPPGCGDGVCAPPTENCANCLDDCACALVGTVCRTAPPARPEPHCAYPDSAFTED